MEFFGMRKVPISLPPQDPSSKEVRDDQLSAGEGAASVDGARSLREYLTLIEAARLLPGRKPGKGVSEPTIWRWCLKGLRNGVRLKSEMIGGHRCTTKAWLQEFIETLNGSQGGTTDPQPRNSDQRRRASERAAEELRKRWHRQGPTPKKNGSANSN
jgi:hypothetical protein